MLATQSKSCRPLLSLILLSLLLSSATSQWSNSSTCDATESAGIDQCQSAGSGFTLDQAKYKSCPQLSVNTNTSEWSCDQWKCHVYCSNPARSTARKSCTNCDEVDVGDGCWIERQERCEAAMVDLEGCDVLCSTAVIHHAWILVASMCISVGVMVL